MASVITVTKEGTFYKGKKYSPGEKIDTGRLGGQTVSVGGKSSSVRTVVAGQPEIGQEQAQALASMTREQGRLEVSTTQTNKGTLVTARPERVISGKQYVISGTPGVSSRDASSVAGFVRTVGPVEQTKSSSDKLVFRESSVEALKKREALSKELERKGFSAEELVYGKKQETKTQGTITSTTSEPTGRYGELIKTTPLYPLYKLKERFKQKGREEEVKAQRFEGYATKTGRIATVKSIGYTLGSKTGEAVLFGIDLPRTAVNVATNPLIVGRKVVEVVRDPYKVGYSFGESLITEPIVTGSKVAFDVGVYPSLAKRSANAIRDLGVRAYGTEVEASKYFDPDTLKKVEAGETAFPLTKSPEASVKAFEETRTSTGLNVISASPQPISTFGQSRVVVVGEGTSSGGVGLFTAPKGKGSPYFLKIGGYEPISEAPSFSLLPRVDRPTATVVTGVSGVTRIPFKTLKEGVEAGREFIRGKKGTGEVVITPGSEAAFDPRLRFDPLTGKKAFATSELESNIPPGSVLVTTGDKNLLLGYSEYVVVRGKPVPIREYEITKLGVDVAKKQADDLVGSSSYSGKSARLSPSYVSGKVSDVSSLSSGVAGVSYVYSSGREALSSFDYSSKGSVSVSRGVGSYSSTSYVGSSPVSRSISRSSSSSVSRVVSSSVVSSPVSSSPSRSVSNTSYSSKLTVIPEYSVKPSLYDRNKPKDRVGGVLVQVRKAGKFITVGRAGSIGEGLRTGGGITRGTARASFRLLSRGGVVKGGLAPQGFYSSPSEGGVFIEKTKYRINTPGELGEITYKGLSVQSSKRKRKGVLF